MATYIYTYLKSQLNTNMTELASLARSLINDNLLFRSVRPEQSLYVLQFEYGVPLTNWDCFAIYYLLPVLEVKG